ncbi:MAG TPA: PIG-L deacetylase family protein [Candidatus Saccharimonadales bacterium]|nr:PIG-L deacetylase family protein [Candidatus Saccharimonadales bacterium]
MKRQLFGIFAHPDDEAFGPSGTLYKEAQAGTEVHLVCVTDGDAGFNCDGCTDLGETRLQEWKESARLIGATTMKALHYPDSGLCNNLFHEIEDKISQHITEVIGDTLAELNFITFDQGGVSGHLDHILVSNITSQIYYKLQASPPVDCRVGQLRYFCLSEDSQPHPDTSWVYMPAGKPAALIDQTVDVRDVRDQKLEIMKAHYSQRDDMNALLQNRAKAINYEHFWFAK